MQAKIQILANTMAGGGGGRGAVTKAEAVFIKMFLKYEITKIIIKQLQLQMKNSIG